MKKETRKRRPTLSTWPVDSNTGFARCRVDLAYASNYSVLAYNHRSGRTGRINCAVMQCIAKQHRREHLCDGSFAWWECAVRRHQMANTSDVTHNAYPLTQSIDRWRQQSERNWTWCHLSRSQWRWRRKDVRQSCRSCRFVSRLLTWAASDRPTTSNALRYRLSLRQPVIVASARHGRWPSVQQSRQSQHDGKEDRLSF